MYYSIRRPCVFRATTHDTYAAQQATLHTTILSVPYAANHL